MSALPESDENTVEETEETRVELVQGETGTEVSLTPRDWQRPWMAGFFQGLALTGNVSRAARLVGINRSHVDQLRRSNPVFAEAWREALQVAAELIENEVVMEARQKRVVTVVRTRTLRDARGRVIEVETTEETRNVSGGSDQIRLALLKALKPEVYGDRAEVRHLGADGGPVRVEVMRDPGEARVLELVRIAGDLGVPSSVDEVVDGEVVEEEDAGDGG